jgi:hypothetical protein
VTDVELVAQGIGVSPEAMAACGVEASAVAAMFLRLGDCGETVDALRASQQDAATAAGQIAGLREQIMVEAECEGLLAELETAESALMSANQAVAAHTAQLWTVATNGLDQTSAARLAVYRGTSGRRAPNTYKVHSCEEGAWAAVETALIAEARAGRLGQELDGRHASVLAAVRGDAAVVQAGQQYDGLLATLRLLFQPE